MPWIPRDVTDAELDVLKLLWKREPAVVRDLVDVLYPDGTHAQYATVQSLLDRLERKGYVSRAKDGRLNVYRAAVSESELLVNRLKATADSLCDGSMAPLLSHLFSDTNLSEADLEALERLKTLLESEPSGAGREQS